MIRGIETPRNVKKYVETLKPIEDFTTLTKGQKIFNKESLSVDYVDTFISYCEERNTIEYENCKGEVWYGPAKDFWFYV